MSTPKGRPRDPERVRHMLEAATWIVNFTSQHKFDDLLNDKLFQSAVERQFEILGEAASPVAPATQQQWPAINWKGIRAFRNIIAHEYFRTDYIEVWHVAHHIVPPLLPLLTQLFTDLDQQFGPDASV
ncbi:MAG: DUF86 domain-containing protein [Hymenobacter sp.]|nr:MAG: DUF86 domain-containing protein [Hymenobacter sp.]